ncbi:MAG TPA: c-type cytochrome [Chitinophagaceae bacterium]|nr:c-type cytochrome [Chitinophagaceae bacterium]
MKTPLIMAGMLALLVGAAGFRPFQQEPWPVPDKYVKMANPVKSDATSIAAGKELWAKHCQSCHGKTGKGDGPKAAQLKTQPADFNKPDFTNQTDGAIFYKTSEGRKDMPSFKKKIDDPDDIWSIVNYIRSMHK